ncbi:MAG: hypothetical protein Q9160_004234 [Pyrenula sp. 1 TL-2023]
MERLQQRKITRNRELRACTECRKRKLKCDRHSPCSSCVRREEAASCIYEKKFEGPQSEYERRLRAEARLGHLEQLVQELSQPRQAPTDLSQSESGPRTTQGTGNEVPIDLAYSGATHWSSMLEDIEELREAIMEPEYNEDPDTDPGGIDRGQIGLLYGAAKPVSFQQVLSQSLPPRQEADRLVAAYFRARAVAASYIHSAQFMRQYRGFWEDPSKVSPLWTSLLFSMLDIAKRVMSPTSAAVEDSGSRALQFSTAAAHCLVIGNYHRPQRLVVESLLLYAQARCIASIDIPPELAVVFGTLGRLAVTMGYHRDADESQPNMSAFEREMRRRTWSLYLQLDMLVSFQLGLPSNVQFPTWDTRPPTNLQDLDFDEDSAELPLARPESEPTELLFYIAKHRLMVVFEKILRHSLSVYDQPIEELEMLDQELRNAYEALPPVFKVRPISDSVIDSASVIVTRLCVTFIYQKCLCVLHRKYVPSGRLHSVQTCYHSASDLVARFVDMSKEFEPGGQLESERWFMGSISWHDFLLGCTVLSLMICSTRHWEAGPACTATVDVIASTELLQSAQTLLFQKQSANSKDTRRVARLVEATVTKFSSQSFPLIGSEYTPSNEPWQAMPPSQGDVDPGSQWNESNMWSTEDPTWTYMEQFLDLPNDYFMTDTGN